jgi:hypothetical protein
MLCKIIVRTADKRKQDSFFPSKFLLSDELILNTLTPSRPTRLRRERVKNLSEPGQSSDEYSMPSLSKSYDGGGNGGETGSSE